MALVGVEVAVVQLVANGAALEGWFAAACKRTLPAFNNVLRITFILQSSGKAKGMSYLWPVIF